MALKKKITLPFLIILLFLNNGQILCAQQTLFLGSVSDTTGMPLPDVTVFIPAQKAGTMTDVTGRFSIALKYIQIPFRMVFSCVGYISDTVTVKNIDERLSVILRHDILSLGNIRVTAFRRDQVAAINIPVEATVVIPAVSSAVEAVVQTLPGVAAFSELSSQYSVRGGSYDENLVYINDIEVFKPYLIRSGQQEGLSQINPDLTLSVSFSPGGFSAKYGDRMSSVLDIIYRKPDKNEASISLSLLTSSAYSANVSKDGRLYLMTGIRYRSNALILNSLDRKGHYKPVFTDLQTQAGYRINEKSSLTLSLFGSSNKYSFAPESQTTSFGSLYNAYKLYAAFDGGERDLYSNLTAAITYDVKHNSRLGTKLILSYQAGVENENYDIRGAYSLRSLDETEQTKFEPDSMMNVGIGSWLDHARNRLRSDIVTLSYRGSDTHGSSQTEWGITSGFRSFRATIDEWLRVDSAGYTIDSGDENLSLTSRTNSSERLRGLATSFFVNNTKEFLLASKLCELNTGIRAVFDTYSNDILVSPRASLRIRPGDDVAIHISIGAYHQLPGGRELMRKMEGSAYPLKAQRSYHLSTGVVYDFNAWGRPFRFTADMYGKKMDRLIPYTVDNVRLNYYGGNIAEGYSAGLDMRVNGEFVEGTESWFSLSLMKAAMRMPSKQSGWFPSPFDQRLNIDIFFQDYLPSYPEFRASVNIVFGTGIPTSPEGSAPWEVWFRMPPYRRIDIGFSKVLIGEVKGRKIGRQGTAFKELSAGLEIFNLADIKNTISYTWIRSVNNSDGLSIQYAVPNYLTGRSLNFKLSARF